MSPPPLLISAHLFLTHCSWTLQELSLRRIRGRNHHRLEDGEKGNSRTRERSWATLKCAWVYPGKEKLLCGPVPLSL